MVWVLIASDGIYFTVEWAEVRMRMRGWAILEKFIEFWRGGRKTKINAEDTEYPKCAEKAEFEFATWARQQKADPSFHSG
jgi:hypothetical protein